MYFNNNVDNLQRESNTDRQALHTPVFVYSLLLMTSPQIGSWY